MAGVDLEADPRDTLRCLPTVGAAQSRAGAGRLGDQARPIRLALVIAIVAQLVGGATRADPGSPRAAKFLTPPRPPGGIALPPAPPPRIRHLYDGPCAELDDGAI